MHRFGQQGIPGQGEQLTFEAQQLVRLSEDIKLISTTGIRLQAVVAELSTNAPLLENWRYAARPVPCLVGNSFGHPILRGDNRPIFTSEVFLISEELGCARTFSRWYRLGRPYGNSEDC